MMKTKKPDRRIQRTRKLLLEAFVDLILEKGYKKITVQNIIDRANVGRSTFYSHFQDKDDLMESGFSEFAHDFYQQVDHGADHSSVAQEHVIHSLDFFLHAHRNRALYLAMAETGGRDLMLDIGRRHIQENIQSHISHLAAEEKTPFIPTSVISNYLAGALQSLLIWWLENDMPYSPEEMDTMFNQLAMPGLWEVLAHDVN